VFSYSVGEESSYDIELLQPTDWPHQ